MNEPDLVLVFDLLDAGFKDWRFSAFGLIFVAIGFLLVRFPQKAMELFHRTHTPKYFRGFSRVFFIFGVFWTALAFSTTFGSYLSLRSAYTDGKYEAVEGPVQNFHPMPASGHANESFTVSGQDFSYSDFSVTPGFNNARSRGGPIGEGVYVKIFHINGKIVRLEVERQAAEAAKQRRQSLRDFPTPPKGSSLDAVLKYAWIYLALIAPANALTWRWRGRKHIAQDPTLREGYNRMATALAFWGSLPFVAGAIGSFLGGANMFEVIERSNWSWSAAGFKLTWGLVVALWNYWIFIKDGAAKLARHPGISDHEWVAKVYPVLAAAIYIVFIAREFV